MKVRRFYRPGALWAAPTESIREAARKMRRSGLSCLPVIEDDSVIGIVTERDLVEAVANSVAPAEGRVLEYMNDGTVTVSLDEDSSTAELKMLAIGCRHLPVVDGGKLVGTVSARDLFLMQTRDEGVQIDLDRTLVGAAVGADDGGWPAEPPPDVDSES